MFESEQTERSGNDADTCGGKMMKPGKGLLKEMEQYACRHHVPIINRETAELLIVLGRLVRPARILEIGTAIGYSCHTAFGHTGKGRQDRYH